MAEPICTGCWAIIAPMGGILVRRKTGELMIYGMEVEAQANLPKGCTIARVDVHPAASRFSERNPND